MNLLNRRLIKKKKAARKTASEVSATIREEVNEAVTRILSEALRSSGLN